MININEKVELTKVIKFAGNYLENGDIVKLIYRNGNSEIGELLINDDLDEITIKTIDNMYFSFIHDSDFLSIEKASEIDVLIWKFKTDNELQKKLAEVTTKEMERKSKIKNEIEELQKQL